MKKKRAAARFFNVLKKQSPVERELPDFNFIRGKGLSYGLYVTSKRIPDDAL